MTGWSYGGYMTMWTVTQTNRFRGAVAGAGIANWQSYYGQNLIDQWMIPFFGSSVYDDPAVYRKSSPIEYIKKVKTPTLVAYIPEKAIFISNQRTRSIDWTERLHGSTNT